MESKVNLVYVLNDTDRINLYSSSLIEIDNITRLYKNDIDFISNSASSSKVSEYKKNTNKDVISERLELIYIDDRDKSEILEIIYNDRPIIMSIDAEKSGTDEIEIGRKLMWSSKNNIFLKLILDSPIMGDTFASFIYINPSEVEKLRKYGFEPLVRENSFYIKIRNIFRWRLETTKLGPLRHLFEDSLELWKKELSKLSPSLKYYYSREIRLIRNKYIAMVSSNMKVNNLSIKHVELNNYNLLKLNIIFIMK